jgi:hypothetical protein
LPNKKIKTIQSEFKENFGLTLRVYKGKQFADPELTVAALDKRTSKSISSQNESIKIKANMTIGEVEKLVDEHFGLTIQVANEHNTYCVNNGYTLGQASRKEDLKDWCVEKGFGSIEKWLESENCKTIDEYYQRKK